MGKERQGLVYALVKKCRKNPSKIIGVFCIILTTHDSLIRRSPSDREGQPSRTNEKAMVDFLKLFYRK